LGLHRHDLAADAFGDTVGNPTRAMRYDAAQSLLESVRELSYRSCAELDSHWATCCVHHVAMVSIACHAEVRQSLIMRTTISEQVNGISLP